jgi:hypothetical protein
MPPPPPSSSCSNIDRQVNPSGFNLGGKCLMMNLFKYNRPRDLVGVKGEGKAIPVTGRGGPYGCETSRLPHFLDNRLTDGGEVVSLTRLPAAL